MTTPFGEQYLPAVGGKPFEEKLSEQVYQQQLSDQFWREGCLHIVLGSDSGLLIKHLMKKCVPKHSYYLFIETEQLLDSVKKLCPIGQQWQQNIRLCHIDNWQQVAEQLAISQFIFHDAVIGHTAITINESSESGYRTAANSLNSQLDILVHRTKIELNDNHMITSCLDNLAENNSAAIQLDGAFQQQSCIILGAGPSLESEIEWIKCQRKKLVIIAVSRLACRLIEEGLIPDIVIAIDYMPVSFATSKEMLSFPDSVLFIHANHVNSQLLGQWYGQNLYLGQRYPWQSPNCPDNINDWGPNVANTTVVMALRMGFKNILLSGIDLCFSSESNRHIRSNAYQQAQNPVAASGSSVETYSGIAAQTDDQMELAAIKLAEQISALKKNHCRIINLASNARKIIGIEYLPSTSIELPAQQKTNWKVLVGPYSSAEKKQYLKDCQLELSSKNKLLQKLSDHVRDAKILNKKIFRKNKAGSFDMKAKAKLDKLQHKLDHDAVDLAVTLKKLGLKYFLEFSKPEDESLWSDNDIKAKGETYYTAWQKSIVDYKDIIQSTQKRIEARIEELKVNGDMKLACKQWQKDQQSARAYWWLQQNADRFELLTAELKIEINQLANTFQTEQSPAVTDGKQQNMNNNSTNISEQELCDGMLLAMEQQQYNSAERIAAQLSQFDIKYQATYAGILRLNKKYNESINTYTDYLQQIPDDTATWLELSKLYKDINEHDLADMVLAHVLALDPDNTSAQELLS